MCQLLSADFYRPMWTTMNEQLIMNTFLKKIYIAVANYNC